jgi:hypothetical protein
MYNIPIDEQNYHTNSLSAKELLWGKTTYKRVLTRYSKLNEFVNETTKPLNLNKTGIEQLLTSVTLAFCHTIKNFKQPATEAQLDKTLKTWINAFLPYIVQNLLLCRYSHLIQFEPIAMCCNYVVNNYQKVIIDLTNSAEITKLSEFELFSFQEFANLVRAISSCLKLFFTGDDVHGISLYRGVLEIFSKISLAQKFPEEYVLFKNFNVYLQKKKQLNEPLPSEMIEYLKNEPLYAKTPENFLAYGWAKDLQGNRILSMKQLILNAITAEKTEVESLLQLASEFVHEDYVGVGYDYISIRKEMIDCYYALLRILSCEEIFGEFSQKLMKSIRPLQNRTDSIYTGRFPLSHTGDLQ